MGQLDAERAGARVQQSQHPNPLVLIKEIEKSGRGWNGSIFSAMTPFLERETARRLCDISLDAELDLSWVSYVATVESKKDANEIDAEMARLMAGQEPPADHLARQPT